MDAEGAVMNNPNRGGYLGWGLDPRYKIYMDLQMSVFDAVDFFTALRFFTDENVRDRVVARYNPPFLIVPAARKPFDVPADFVPVFIDSTEVLFVNAQHYPEIAKSFRISSFDPLKCDDIDYESIDDEQAADMRMEAGRLLAHDQENLELNTILGNLAMRGGDYPAALDHGQTLIDAFPRNPAGYAILSGTMYHQGKTDEALKHGRRAIAVGGADGMKLVRNTLYLCYVKGEDKRRAYRVLKKGIDPYGPDTTAKELHALGIAAGHVGKLKDARFFLRLARWAVSEDNDELQETIEKALTALEKQ